MHKKNFSVILCAGSSFRKVVQLSMDRVINRKQWNKKTTFSWTYTEITLGEAKYARSARLFFSPPLGAPRGGGFEL